MQKHRSLPHNPDIANTFFRAGFIESWGRGIEKICNLCKEYGIAEPEYTVHPNDIMMMFKANWFLPLLLIILIYQKKRFLKKLECHGPR